MLSIHRSRPGIARAAGARGAGLLRAFCAVALAGAPLLAFEEPGGGRNLPPPSNTGGQVAGDETIGTLPIVAPTVPFDLFRFLVDRQASLTLEGARFDVLSAIVGIEGRSAATIEMLDPNADVVRLTFHGSPRLVLDRGLVDSGAVHLGVSVPTAFGPGWVEARLGMRLFASESIGAGVVDVPFLAAGDSSPLVVRPLALRFDGANGAHTTLGFRVTEQFILVGQSH